MVDMVLFPSSFFNVSEVDEDLQKEYDAVAAAGLFDVALFSYSKWLNEEKLVIKNVPNEEHFAVYRGWMMKPEQYERQVMDTNGSGHGAIAGMISMAAPGTVSAGK